MPIKVAVRCEVTRHITACFDEFKCVSRLQQQSDGSRATYSIQSIKDGPAVSLLKVCK